MCVLLQPASNLFGTFEIFVSTCRYKVSRPVRHNNRYDNVCKSYKRKLGNYCQDNTIGPPIEKFWRAYTCGKAAQIDEEGGRRKEEGGDVVVAMTERAMIIRSGKKRIREFLSDDGAR